VLVNLVRKSTVLSEISEYFIENEKRAKTSSINYFWSSIFPFCPGFLIFFLHYPSENTKTFIYYFNQHLSYNFTIALFQAFIRELCPLKNSKSTVFLQKGAVAFVVRKYTKLSA